MPRTDFDDVYDGQGNRMSRTSRQVSDRDVLADGSPERLRQAYAGLRQWSLDAQDVFDTWPTKTSAQKDAAQRETIRRLGVFFARFGDLLLRAGEDG